MLMLYTHQNVRIRVCVYCTPSVCVCVCLHVIIPWRNSSTHHSLWDWFISTFLRPDSFSSRCVSAKHTTTHKPGSHKHTHSCTHTGLGRLPEKERCACLCLGCGRATRHYSSHTRMFTQGCGLTEKTFQPQQLSFFKPEIRHGPCDITPAKGILLWPALAFLFQPHGKGK